MRILAFAVLSGFVLSGCGVSVTPPAPGGPRVIVSGTLGLQDPEGERLRAVYHILNGELTYVVLTMKDNLDLARSNGGKMSSSGGGGAKRSRTWSAEDGTVIAQSQELTPSGSGTLTLAGEKHELTGGNVFLFRHRGGKTDVKQVDSLVASDSDGLREQLNAIIIDDPRIGQFLSEK